jgi:hypothetical protein
MGGFFVFPVGRLAVPGQRHVGVALFLKRED